MMGIDFWRYRDEGASGFTLDPNEIAAIKLLDGNTEGAAISSSLAKLCREIDLEVGKLQIVPQPRYTPDVEEILIKALKFTKESNY